MVFALLRLAAVIWIFGFIVLALVALSSYLYSTEAEPERTGAPSDPHTHVTDMANRAHVTGRARTPAPRLISPRENR